MNGEQEEEPTIRAAPCLSIMKVNSLTVKQEQLTSKETKEEKDDEEKQRKCNRVFGQCHDQPPCCDQPQCHDQPQCCERPEA